jgi:hypothetical protein
MSAGSLLARIAALLDAAEIPFMIAGSFASTYYGVPRTTHDIDIVFDPSGVALDAWLATLGDADYYVDADVARDAMARRGQFNVIDMASGWKIDFIVRKDRDFSREEMSRRLPASLLGADVFVATVEDTIVAKLEWAKLGASERQERDVTGLLEVHREGLDRVYIERWIRELGLEEQWARVTRNAGN